MAHLKRHVSIGALGWIGCDGACGRNWIDKVPLNEGDKRMTCYKRELHLLGHNTDKSHRVLLQINLGKDNFSNRTWMVHLNLDGQAHILLYVTNGLVLLPVVIMIILKERAHVEFFGPKVLELWLNAKVLSVLLQILYKCPHPPVWNPVSSLLQVSLLIQIPYPWEFILLHFSSQWLLWQPFTSLAPDNLLGLRMQSTSLSLI